MLKTHFANFEKALLALREIQEVTGHTLHKGSPREAFIQEFLRGHLNDRVAIGTGEIIDAKSKPGEKRPQIDVVLYRPEFPKLDFRGGINGFLAESVIATIEVKSTLTYAGLRDAIEAAAKVKALERSTIDTMQVGYSPPGILSYLVAYRGPAKMETVLNWNRKGMKSLDITVPDLPKSLPDRAKVPSPALDAIFVLGKGFLQFDNSRLSFSTEARQKRPGIRWCLGDTTDGSLFALFLLITVAASEPSMSQLNANPYLVSFQVETTFAE